MRGLRRGQQRLRQIRDPHFGPQDHPGEMWRELGQRHLKTLIRAGRVIDRDRPIRQTFARRARLLQHQNKDPAAHLRQRRPQIRARGHSLRDPRGQTKGHEPLHQRLAALLHTRQMRRRHRLDHIGAW